MEKTAAFVTLGCKVNQYETDAMKELFAAAGYEIRDFSAPASVYIVNTCTVTSMADHKSRQMIHRARRSNPDAVVAAVGCYVQDAADKLRSDPAIDIVVGNDMKTKIVDIVEEFISAKETERSQIYVPDMKDSVSYEDMKITSSPGHTRAYIKIQDGCNQFCSYCIIPYVRGWVRSRSLEDIVSEASRLTQDGCRELVLTGIHISSYGMDFEHGVKDDEEDYAPFNNSRLIDLIEAVSEVSGVERIRLGSLEPRIITEDFVRRLSGVPQICPHFHLSLQSGCDMTLKRMNRHYSTDMYLEKCGILRRYFDRPAITTDVITGFPGETDEEFETTRRFLEKVRFAGMHIFKYSKREGTRAAVMPDQVPGGTASKRSDILIKLAADMHSEYEDECADQEQDVLIEEETGVNGVSYMTGYSRNYIRCGFESGEITPNMVVKGQIIGKSAQNFVICKIIH